MSTPSLSFPALISPSDSQNPLLLLASVAADSRPLDTPSKSQRTVSATPEPTRTSKRISQRRYAFVSHSDSEPESTMSSRSSMSPTPTLVDSDRHSVASSSPDSCKSRKACHRSPKATEAQKCARAAREPRRKEVLARALRIKTVENSPVNEQQLRVLRMVYDEITKYPKDHWIAILAVIIQRSFAQVKHWFSNERQKNKSGDSVDWINELGEKIRVRPMAIELCDSWSDELFENVVMIFSFRSHRILQWVH